MKNMSTLKFMPIILVSQFIKESTGRHTFCSIPWNLMNFSQIQRIYLPQSKDNNGSGSYLYVQFCSDKKSVLLKTSVKKERKLYNSILRILITTTMPNKFDNFGAIVLAGLKWWYIVKQTYNHNLQCVLVYVLFILRVGTLA